MVALVKEVCCIIRVCGPGSHCPVVMGSLQSYSCVRQKGMVLSSTHSFSAFARRQEGAQWSSFAAANSSGGLCWDTKRAYCVKMWWSLRVCHKFQPLWSARKKKINLTAVPLWTDPGNYWTSLAHTIVHLTWGWVALNFVNPREHSWKRNSEIF